MSIAAILGDEVKAKVGGKTVTLRPTLRAGIAALALYGSFSALLRKIDEFDTATIKALTELGAGFPQPLLFYGWETQGYEPLQTSLSDYTVILANGGTRPDYAVTSDEGGAPLSHSDYFAQLFKIGTGWIGWTHEQTLDAPMPAIISALSGRKEMLASIFGSAEGETGNTIPLDEKVQIALSHFGGRKVKRT